MFQVNLSYNVFHFDISQRNDRVESADRARLQNKGLLMETVCNYIVISSTNIVAAFRGMHVSPAKHSYGSVTDGQTDRRTDRQTTDKVIPMCRYASQATQKCSIIDSYSYYV